MSEHGIQRVSCTWQGGKKKVSDGPSSRGFAFRYALPPPLSSAQLKVTFGVSPLDPKNTVHA